MSTATPETRGRKKATNRCPCGKMTRARASKRYHYCAPPAPPTPPVPTDDEFEYEAAMKYGAGFVAQVAAAWPSWKDWGWTKRLEVLEAEAGRGGAW